MVLLNIFKIPLRTSCDSVVPCLFQRNVTENYYTSEMVGDERFDCYIYSGLKKGTLIKLPGNFNAIRYYYTSLLDSFAWLGTLTPFKDKQK